MLLLNGQELQVPPLWRTGGEGDRGELLLHVLPGQYTFELPEAGGPLVPRSVQVLAPPVIGPWRTGTVVLDYGLTRFSDSQARSTILPALADCARSTSPQPPDCPFSVDLPEGTQGTWRLVTSPTLSYVSMRGSSVNYRGTGLVAEFTETSSLAPAGFTAAVSAAATSAPRTHLTTVDVGTSLRRGATGFRREGWGCTSQRAWPA